MFPNLFDLQSNLVSRPLDGVLYNRRERFESAERYLLLWWISLQKLKRHDVKELLFMNYENSRKNLMVCQTHTYMTVIGLCQIWQNNFCVSLCPHGAWVEERFSVGHAATEI